MCLRDGACGRRLPAKITPRTQVAKGTDKVRKCRHYRLSRQHDTTPAADREYSPGFAEWLKSCDGSLALTTYQSGRLIFIGRKPDGSIRGHERQIEHCQGLWTNGSDLWVSGKAMLWRFKNALQPGESQRGWRYSPFAPREGRVTGQLDVHDIGVRRTRAAFIRQYRLFLSRDDERKRKFQARVAA